MLEPDALERAAERRDAEREARELLAGLSVLPGGVRAVVELVVVYGLDLAEAAHALGISVGDARVRLHRGRRLAATVSDPTPPTEEAAR